MDLKNNQKINKSIKLVLVFFLFSFLYQCKSDTRSSEIKVIYEEGKAKAIELGPGINDFQVYLTDNKNIPVLGTIKQKGEKSVFTPAIPFTKGQTYAVKKNQLPLGEFKIKNSRQSSAEIINIFPTADYVPQNLLKMYIQFSEPMQAIGKSSDYIKIYDAETMEEKSVFLKLENELWNKEQDLLTLWLDPGRIKKDLIPNKENGMPLISGNSYRMEISRNWQTKSGNNLEKDFIKLIQVGNNDNIKPDIKSWSLQIPKSNTNKELRIDFNEILDSQLALETIAIYDSEENYVPGKFSLLKEEGGVSFVPLDNWRLGDYTIEIESRLEDLAGNNLYRLFDTDLLKDTPTAKIKNFPVLRFNIK